jgi:1-acyl-sn-glycerol-3-phosphate acyltransferase
VYIYLGCLFRIKRFPTMQNNVIFFIRGVPRHLLFRFTVEGEFSFPRRDGTELGGTVTPNIGAMKF